MLNLIVIRAAHHAEHSGYDRIVDYLDNGVFQSDGFRKILDVVPERIYGFFLRNSNWYLVPELKTEIEVFVNSVMRKGAIYHFLYGENTYRFTGRFNPRKNQFVATFHLPPSRFYELFKPELFRGLQVAVALSRIQYEYLEKIGVEKIVFIRHGVDIDFFRPDFSKKKNKECLFVGTHLRDFQTLRTVIEKVNQFRKDIHFTIVTFEDNFKNFSGLENITLLHSVRDNVLLELYQRSSLLLIPFLDCTACNAVLEAMACGLPVVSNRVGGIADYVDESRGILCEGDLIAKMAEAVIMLCDHTDIQERLGQSARSFAESELDWRVVVDQYRQKVYRLR